MPRRHSIKKHIPYEHKAPCGTKRSFKTEQDAIDAIDSSVSGVRLKTYQCPYCQKWHLSSEKT